MMTLPIMSTMTVVRLLVVLLLQLTTVAVITTSSNNISDDDYCQDSHSQCPAWAESGECDENPRFMKAHCPKSCHSCIQLDPRLLTLGPERVILQIKVPAGSGSSSAEGDGVVQEVELGFFPLAAPVTVAHIVNLFRQGCYDTNHVFRVDKGFVAQIQSVHPSAVIKPLSSVCVEQGNKNVPGEFTFIPHRRGILSMGRHEDPDSGGSSFSMLLGDAPHLDNQYTVFGKVMRGDDVLTQLEKMETRKEGIFVMPVERITIVKGWVVEGEDENVRGEEEEEL